MPISYGPMHEHEQESVHEVLSSAFAIPKDHVPSWLERASVENVRVLRAGAEPVAALLQVPMAHRLMGRPVATVGIAGVGVALHHRGSQVAAELMRRCVGELHKRQVPLSSLFPATQTLYRKVGWERAGKLLEVTLPASALENLPKNEAEVGVRRLNRTDQPAMEALLSTASEHDHGVLVRGSYLWERLWSRPDVQARAFGFYQLGELIGYLVMVQEPDPAQAPHHTVRVTDFAFKSREGALAILGFLKNQRSLCKTFRLRGAWATQLMQLLREPDYQENSVLDWMLRITHLESALLQRGYAPGSDRRVAIALTDPVLPEQTGSFVLSIRAGKATLERASGADAALSIGAFATLFSGLLSAFELQKLGLLRADIGVVATLHDIFRAPVPWVGEMF